VRLNGFSNLTGCARWSSTSCCSRRRRRQTSWSSPRSTSSRPQRRSAQRHPHWIPPVHGAWGPQEGWHFLDAGHITQAWLQLADNAVKYSTPASPIVAAAQMSQTGTDRWLNLSVRDSGPGIPPAAQERIFERFSQLGSSGATEGSGLGLPIVSAIAEAHGGSVLLSGAPGEGSTFTIRVPLVTEAQPSQADEEKR
jgi:signal transduction histidine kinase